MAYYRLYFLDAGDRIKTVVEFNCDSDDNALADARRHVGGRSLELWNERRLVARFAADRAAKDEPMLRSGAG